jgi:hypothetical protein
MGIPEEQCLHKYVEPVLLDGVYQEIQAFKIMIAYRMNLY